MLGIRSPPISKTIILIVIKVIAIKKLYTKRAWGNDISPISL